MQRWGVCVSLENWECGWVEGVVKMGTTLGFQAKSRYHSLVGRSRVEMWGDL